MWLIIRDLLETCVKTLCMLLNSDTVVTFL